MPDFADLRGAGAGPVLAGTVSSAVTAAKTVTLTINGQPVECRVLRDVTLAIGDVALVLRDGATRWVVGRLYAAAPSGAIDTPSDPVATPKPTVTKGTTVFSPVETRSYRSSYGWRSDNDDVYQGQYGGWGNNIGCAFYGRGPASLKGATVTSASIKVRRLSGGDYAARTTTLRQVTQRTRPSGAPTLTASAVGPSIAVGATFSFAIPPGWAQDLVDGVEGGLAIYDADGSPYVRLAGKSSYSPAFALTINWSR